MNRHMVIAQFHHSPLIPLMWYIVVSVVMYSLMGGPILVLIVPFGAVYGAWLFWGWRHPIQTTPTFERLYLLLFAWQLLHLAEELTTGFYRTFPALWGQMWNGDPAHYSVWGVVSFIDGNLALDFFWVIAFLLLPLRNAWANYAFYTLLTGMAINAVQHPLYALYLWWHPTLQVYLHTVQHLDYTWYFPGLFTSFGHALFSFLMIRYLLMRSLRHKQ